MSIQIIEGKLPWHVEWCLGEGNGWSCEIRDECRRYTDRMDINTWMLHPHKNNSGEITSCELQVRKLK